jgi:hypothetical protein
VSSKWEPDDSILETGHDAIREATGVSAEEEIITSRDPGRRPLPGRRMPPGIHQNLLPVTLPGKILAFQSKFDPNVELPSHAHPKAAIFRLVVEGTLFHGATELKAGDWMYVPPGKEYELRTGAEPCRVWHMYIGPIVIRIPLP